MKKMLSLLVAAALVMGWSSNSFAGNPYASANIGIAWFDDIEGTHVDLDEREESFEITCDSGLTLTGALGYDMGSTRVEAELGYQKNEVTLLSKFDDGEFDEDWDGTGDISLTTFMFNGYYDIKPMDNSDIELFLTAGIGAAFYNFDDVGVLDDEENIGSVNGSTWAYQLGGGVAIPVGSGIVVDARYRYFNTGDFSTNEDFNGFRIIDDEDDDAYNLSIGSHSALVGLRYNF